MARLTRTQKYADLRESLANDKEESFQTKELSSYQNRLNNVTGGYNQSRRPVENDPRYTWTEFEETPIEDLVGSFKNQEFDRHMKNNSVFNSIQEDPRQQRGVPNDYDIAKLEEEDYIDDLVESINLNTIGANEKPRQNNDYNRPQQQPYQRPVQPQPVQQPVNNYNYQQPVQQPVNNYGYQQPVQQPVYQNAPVINERPAPEYREEVKTYTENVNPAPAPQPTYYQPEQIVKEEFEPYRPEPAPVEQPVVNEVKKEPEVKEENPFESEILQPKVTIQPNQQVSSVSDTRNTYNYYEEKQPTAIGGSHEDDHSNDAVNSYISSTMEEVDAYNKQNGEQTIGQLTNNMVNEIRHREGTEEVEEKFVEEPVKENDDEFSNTVSMEISKIIDEVSANKKPEEERRPEPAVEERPVERPVEEHPVLAQTLAVPEEDENVVEIKNLNEIENEATLTRDTVSNTIPFVVTADEDEEIEDDEEGSNTILNIILIVLIIILVVVLGLIVFYILKTKGII